MQPQIEVTNTQGNWRDTDPRTQNQNKQRNGSGISDDRLRDLPEWLEEFTESRKQGNACARTRFSGLRVSGRPSNSGIKVKDAWFFYSLPKRPKLRSMQKDQNYEGSLLKPHR